MSLSLVQRSPIDCDASCVITKSRGLGGHRPRWAVKPEKIIINKTVNHLPRLYDPKNSHPDEECVSGIP
jgi:hypothetical protein